MDSLTNLAFLAGVFDLAIILATILFVAYAVRTGMFSSNPVTSGAWVLIVAALLIGLVSQLTHTWDPAPHGNVADSLIDRGSFEWVHWLAPRLVLAMLGIGLFLAWYQRQRSDRVLSFTNKRLRKAEEYVQESEARYRNLFDSTFNGVFCFQFEEPLDLVLPLDEQIRRTLDAVLVECNPVYAASLGGDGPSDVVGVRLGKLPIAHAEKEFVQLATDFIENDYSLSEYEIEFTGRDGLAASNQLSLFGVLEGGRLKRIWGIEKDISELRRVEAELRRQRRFEELLADISMHLVMAPDEAADESVNQCLQRVCEFYKVDRGTLWWMDTDTTHVDPVYTWRRSTVPVRPHDVAVEYPLLWRELQRGRVVAIVNVDETDEKQATDRANLAKMGIRSIAAIPLMVSGAVFGAASFACDKSSCAWSEQELKDLRVFADMIANFVLRVRSRRALDDAMGRLQKASDRLEAENVYLREEVEVTQGFDEIIGNSNEIRHCLHLVEKVASTMTSVLILGPTGTGKELIARAIHEHSDRSSHPLVKVNCAALPASLIESELFGHEKGAFTGADKAKRGRFDLADGSTLFLDEIGELPVDLQAKLLRVLQEGEFERVGGGKTVKVDVRIIAATNRDLHRAVADGEFRSDLFFRINTFPIELPPLRARGDDVQLLAEHFVKHHAKRLGKDVKAISASMMRQLREYHWPGNIRELEGVIERAMIASNEPVLKLASPLVQLESRRTSGPKIISSTVADLRIVEREHITSVLESCNWRISGAKGAAANLGLPPSTLRSKMKKLGIVRPG